MERSSVRDQENHTNGTDRTRSQTDRRPISPEDAAIEARALTAVSNVRNRFAAMDAKLQAARSEVERLERELRRERAKSQKTLGVPVSSLRRRIAYHLHPDRGGDPQVMSQLNALLDIVESMQERGRVGLAA